MTTEQRLQQLELLVAQLVAIVQDLTTKMNSAASKTTVNRALAMNALTMASIESRLEVIESALKLYFQHAQIQ